MRLANSTICEAASGSSTLTSMPIAMTPGARVRQLRQARGLSEQVLATRAGLSVRWLSLVETDKGRLTKRVAQALAEALGVNPAALLRGEDPSTLLTEEP
jgi:transcriptional regulator with XRE-family HTH domain